MMRVSFLAFTAILAVVTAAHAAAAQFTPVRVSVSPSCLKGIGSAFDASISGDGRYVAFSSTASDLVPQDTNDKADIFVRDMLTGAVTRASVSSSGEQANLDSCHANISANGRVVVFGSWATNLAPGTGVCQWQIFRHDLRTGKTDCVSVSTEGKPGNNRSLEARVSADGRYVAFASEASNLVPDDTNATWDVFRRDTRTGVTVRANVSSTGRQTDGFGGGWGSISMSADGRYIAFFSEATDLVPGDTNNAQDVFLRDMQANTTTLISVSSRGEQANRGAMDPSVSADGRYVAFDSLSTNLVPGDTNNHDDVFVRDTWTRTTTRVSLTSSGEQGKRDSFFPSISADGRIIAFETLAPNLALKAGYNLTALAVSDWQRGVTSGVAIPSLGAGMALDSCFPVISADGRFVAFQTYYALKHAGGADNPVSVFVQGPQDAVAPFTTADVVAILRRFGGLSGAGTERSVRTDLVLSGVSAERLDLVVAVRIARKVAGLEANP
ncbi:MAG TPA: calcium-binding protein [Armatimonadota bacterium]|jgi:Tol biopolymer transport system component